MSIRNIVALLTGIVALCATPSLCAMAVDTVAENEVWALEERYWNDVQTSNVDDFMTLWHDDFQGWPATSALPIPKDSVANMLKDPAARNSRLTSYALHRKVVRVFGNTAIAMYAVTFTWVDRHGVVERTGQWYKLIHTWLRTNHRWKIIGSLSAPLVHPDPS